MWSFFTKLYNVFLILLCTSSVAETRAVPRKSDQVNPNVVLILIDDLGIKDLECYGSKFHNTPNINRLADDGIRFVNAYAAHPKCVPARVGIFSGVYPARFRSPFYDMKSYGYPNAEKCYSNSFSKSGNIPRNNFTSLGEAFKEEGYQTGYIGKWHLGNPSTRRGTPRDQGFDVSIGASYAGSVDSYFYPFMKRGKDEKLPNLTGASKGDYLTDHLTKETNSLITRFQKSPFFIVLAHYAVHVPLEAKHNIWLKYMHGRTKLKNVDKTKYDNGEYYKVSQDNPIYAAMVESVDVSVGNIRRKLAELGLSENTVIIFTSDNGGNSSNISKEKVLEKATSNYPYRHGKQWLYEGGVRVPLIIYDPKRDSRHRISKYPTTGTDLYPTLLDLAGLPARPNDHTDGKSILPAMKSMEDSSLTSRSFYWHNPKPLLQPRESEPFHGPIGALRKGMWKLVMYDRDKHPNELYNLASDPYERSNISLELQNDFNTKLVQNIMLHDYSHWITTLVNDEDFKKQCFYSRNQFYPSNLPSVSFSASSGPLYKLSNNSFLEPSLVPSREPSHSYFPSFGPSHKLSSSPSNGPTLLIFSNFPSVRSFSSFPSDDPSSNPSKLPSFNPSYKPSTVSVVSSSSRLFPSRPIAQVHSPSFVPANESPFLTFGTSTFDKFGCTDWNKIHFHGTRFTLCIKLEKNECQKTNKSVALVKNYCKKHCNTCAFNR
mmetsp:Transcript_28080/g.64270  ORF Transcript_28080/g.64270 Transcript_28080/m.64270 type:complete len:714 (-) Transcript_28080:341-2482(-)